MDSALRRHIGGVGVQGNGLRPTTSAERYQRRGDELIWKPQVIYGVAVGRLTILDTGCTVGN